VNVTIPDWVEVPVEEVALAWTYVERARVADPENRYLLGAVAAFRWAMGTDRRAPLDRRIDLTPTRANALTEDMRATSLVAGLPDPGDEGLSLHVAAGVGAVLGWLLGAVSARPAGLDRQAQIA
jgi:hypothetical protein